MLTIPVIGTIESDFEQSTDPFVMQKKESVLIINPSYQAGLYDIKAGDLLEVIFYFHKLDKSKIKNMDFKTINYFNEEKGIFACRTPYRPSQLGLSRVKVLKVNQNRITVIGLDAINKTPILDIKPALQKDLTKQYDSIIEDNPRKDFVPLLKNRDLQNLLISAGRLHGHYCPGLSLGVMGALAAVNKIKSYSDGLEDLIAIVEINSCFVDGIQMVTGCSLGNNSLIYRDLGKTAFSLITRDGRGVRLNVKNNFSDKLKEQYLDFNEYFTQVVINKKRNPEILRQFKKYAKITSFDLLKWNIDEIYHIEEISIDLPDYAPIKESITCSVCGENIMSGKEINFDNTFFCKCCQNTSCFQLDGQGISEIILKNDS
ncbi:MAG: TrmO family methyltransferase [Spirochaetes bacterium]|nr:TrmO family methyltransferase [Spirochaetota bacterium]